MRPVVPIKLADFFNSTFDFCFQSSISESVSLEEVKVSLTGERGIEVWEHREQAGSMLASERERTSLAPLVLPHKGMADLGNDCEVQLSSAHTHLLRSIICWGSSWDLAVVA